MRRVLFAAFLTIAAFYAFGSDMIEVTAPTVAGEVSDIDARRSPSYIAPQRPASEASHLSDVPTVPAVVMQNAPVAAYVPEVSLGDAHFTGEVPSFAVATHSSPAGVVAERDSNAPQPLFISTWTEIPVAAVHYVANVAASIMRPNEPRAPATTDAERASLMRSSRPTLVAALRTSPGRTVTTQRSETLPAPPVQIVPFAFASSTHQVYGGSTTTGAISRNVAADADRASTPAELTLAAAWTQSPEVIFGRPRYVPLPEQPVIVPSAFLSAGHLEAGSSALIAESRGKTVATASQFASTLPALVNADSQIVASIFQRPRFVPLPERPLIIPTAFVNIEHSELGSADAVSEGRTMALYSETQFASAEMPVFVNAAYQVPASVFVRPRFVPEPTAPAAPLPNAVAEAVHTDLNNEVTINDQLTKSADAKAETESGSSSTLSSFVSAIYEAPSAVIENIRMSALPKEPVFDAPAKISDSHVAFNTFGAVVEPAKTKLTGDAMVNTNSSPVLISADTTMSSATLTPMRRDLLQAAPLANENISTIGSATQFERAIDTTAEPARSSEALPVLISGKPEFSMDLLKPMNSTAASAPFVKLNREEIGAALAQDGGYCDPNWVGPPIRFSQTVELKLDDLIRQLHQRFGVNFIVGKGVADLPMNIKAGSIPWNVLLKSQLFISGVRARCIDTNTIELIENTALPGLQDMADVETRFVKLKFLQRTTNSAVGLSGQSQSSQNGGQSGCGGQSGGSSGGSSGGGQGGGQNGETAAQQGSSKFDKLIIEIEKILGIRSMTESIVGSGASGGNQSSTQEKSEVVRTNRYVTQVPGRNILAIRATKEEHELIDQIIARADRPPFQVVIKGLVYTANQDKLRDIGVQTNIFGSGDSGRQTGEVTGHTLGTGTLFDFSAILGTFDFNVQATALQQNGVISIKSRPFATVVDGLCTTLNVGTSLLIPIDSGFGGQAVLREVNASNDLAVAPYVIDDETGNPVAVTLDLTLTANELDTSVTTRGVPAVSKRSISTQLLLGQDKTAILGGFTVDQDRRSVSKTPGLGDIPIIGELFKRRVNDKRVNRLYFAITATVIPYPEAIRPVDVPGATTDPPSITPEMKKRADKAEPKQVKGP